MLRNLPAWAAFWRGSGWGDPASGGAERRGKSTLLARMAGMTSGKGSIRSRGNHWKHGPQQNSRCIEPSFTTTDATVCNAGLALPDTAQHDKTRTELLNDVAGALALVTNSDVAPINFPAANGNAYVCCGGAANHTTSQSRRPIAASDEPMNSLDVAQQSALDKILTRCVSKDWRL